MSSAASGGEASATGPLFDVVWLEDVERVLDNFQRLGALNTILLTTFTSGRGLSRRQIWGQPFPDHGAQKSESWIEYFMGGRR